MAFAISETGRPRYVQKLDPLENKADWAGQLCSSPVHIDRWAELVTMLRRLRAFVRRPVNARNVSNADCPHGAYSKAVSIFLLYGQAAGATAQISEAWMLPVLEGMLEQFPLKIKGFHSDNGSSSSITPQRSC